MHHVTEWERQKDEMGGNVARTGERRGAYRALMGKPERKRPLGRTSSRWVDIIKLGLQ
jgi:hypothetical protein